MTDDLLDLALRLREQSGRSTTDADRARIATRISRLTSGEETMERAALRRLLDIAAKTPRPNRNRP